MTDSAWFDELPTRAIVDRALEVRFALQPGDRSLVVVDELVAAGTPLLERLRERRIEEVTVPAGDDVAGPGQGPVAGQRWTAMLTSRLRRHGASLEGELLEPIPGRRDRWRMATADHRDTVESPLAGRVAAVLPGGAITVRATGLGVRAALAAGTPAHGRLELATDPFGELRPGGIDVGRAGSILVVGARIDAEALTRARAMGVRGIVVASLSGKDLRDFQASERRQRASLHAAMPFGVIALEGTRRRRIPGPVASLLTRLAGREVGIVTDPPALVFEPIDADLMAVEPDWVWVRSGPSAGVEGRLVGPAGMHHFDGGVQLEAAFVALDDGPAVALPMGDLERLV